MISLEEETYKKNTRMMPQQELPCGLSYSLSFELNKTFFGLIIGFVEGIYMKNTRIMSKQELSRQVVGRVQCQGRVVPIVFFLGIEGCVGYISSPTCSIN